MYETPIMVVISLQETDVVRTSGGDNYEGDDFPAFTGN